MSEKSSSFMDVIIQLILLIKEFFAFKKEKEETKQEELKQKVDLEKKINENNKNIENGNITELAKKLDEFKDLAK